MLKDHERRLERAKAFVAEVERLKCAGIIAIRSDRGEAWERAFERLERVIDDLHDARAEELGVSRGTAAVSP